VVREQLDGGERLIRRLVASGFNLAGGLWTQAEGDGQVYLYLITPEVEGRDPRIAYGKLAATQKAIEQEGVHWLERIDQFGVKLIPPSRPLARGVLEEYRRYPVPTPTWRGGSILGPVYSDGAYIYPPSLFQPQPQAG